MAFLEFNDRPVRPLNGNQKVALVLVGTVAAFSLLRLTGLFRGDVTDQGLVAVAFGALISVAISARSRLRFGSPRAERQALPYSSFGTFIDFAYKDVSKGRLLAYALGFGAFTLFLLTTVVLAIYVNDGTGIVAEASGGVILFGSITSFPIYVLWHRRKV